LRELVSPSSYFIYTIEIIVPNMETNERAVGFWFFSCSDCNLHHQTKQHTFYRVILHFHIYMNYSLILQLNVLVNFVIHYPIKSVRGEKNQQTVLGCMNTIQYNTMICIAHYNTCTLMHLTIKYICKITKNIKMVSVLHISWKSCI
jgi:hypothetical protein